MRHSYADSSITKTASSVPQLAKNVTVGMRMPSAQVVRLSDAKAVFLTKMLQCTGQWRILVFAGNPLDRQLGERLRRFSTGLEASGYSHDLIEPILVLNGSRTEIDDAVVDGSLEISKVFTPLQGEYGLCCKFPNFACIMMLEAISNAHDFLQTTTRSL